MVGHGGSSAGSYLADPTSPIPSHCASIVATSTVRVNVHAHFVLQLSAEYLAALSFIVMARVRFCWSIMHNAFCWSTSHFLTYPHTLLAIHMHSGITSGRVLNGELLYTKILEVNLPTDYFMKISLHQRMSRWLKRNLHETVRRQMQTN